MTYGDLLHKLLDMKNGAPHMLNDEVMFLTAEYPTMAPRKVANAEYNDGSVVGIEQYQFFLLEV